MTHWSGRVEVANGQPLKSQNVKFKRRGVGFSATQPSKNKKEEGDKF